MRLTRALTRRGICRWLALKGNRKGFCDYLYDDARIHQVEIEKETGMVVAFYFLDGTQFNCSIIARP